MKTGRSSNIIMRISDKGNTFQHIPKKANQRSGHHLLHIVRAILRVLDLLPAVRQLCGGTERRMSPN